MKYFWVQCQGCEDCWVAAFVSEFGFLVNLDSNGETCSDCGSEDLEIQDEYEGSGE